MCYLFCQPQRKKQSIAEEADNDLRHAGAVPGELIGGFRQDNEPCCGQNAEL